METKRMTKVVLTKLAEAKGKKVTKVCFTCKQPLDKYSFSNRQWKTAGKLAKCKGCILQFVANHDGRLKRDGTTDYVSDVDNDSVSDWSHDGGSDCCVDGSDAEWEMDAD